MAGRCCEGSAMAARAANQPPTDPWRARGRRQAGRPAGLESSRESSAGQRLRVAARKTQRAARKSISEEEEEETCDMAEGGGLGTAAAAGRRGRVTADAGGRTQDFTVLPTRVEVTLHL